MKATFEAFNEIPAAETITETFEAKRFSQFCSTDS